jgi:murein DD-endopeptidase MepM/ murein hydrolase activator NlpD
LESGVARLDRTDLNLLFVRGDGRYVRWLSCPRWLVKTLIVVAVAGAIANAAALVHYAMVYRERVSLAATNDYLERHAHALPQLRRRLVEVRDEMRGWDALHAEVWKPLGARPRAAVGGPEGGGGARALDDVDALLAYVREESRRLRALAEATRATGSVLAALPSKLPMRGVLTSVFGPRLSPWTRRPEFHAGVDLAAMPGTPVKATAAGIVKLAGAAEGYGLAVYLDHGAGIESRYGHLQKVGVTRGQRVERGEAIGLSGNTGRSTGPHLHYEVLMNGRPIDPRRLTKE